MRRWSPTALLATVLASVALWAVVAAACMMVSSVSVGWPATREIFQLRREVVLLSSLVGAALAAAGVTYQAILRNPLADPYLLGISSGAALFAYLWRLPAFAAVAGALALSGQAASQQAFAFLGAIVAVACVLVLSSRNGRLEPVTLLLVGTLPSSGGALTLLVGGIQTSLTIEQKLVATIIIAVGWIALLAISGQLNAAALQDAEAEALGVRIQRLRWLALIIASLVTASAVAISGPIGFIGLICPHLARLLVGVDQRKLLPVATALGAALLASADAASRRLAGQGLAQTLLPVGVLTSLLGGPFFLLLLFQSRRRIDLSEGRSS